MNTDFYKNLLHELKHERVTLEKRIRIVESWINGKPVYKMKDDARKKMSETMKARWANRGKKKKSSGTKGYSYNGTHWTQDPKRKAEIRAHLKRIAKLNRS